MAQGAVATVPPNGASLTADELREILEYERIVRFRDAVLSGTHPRVKVPPHLAGLAKNTARSVASPRSPALRVSANNALSATSTTPAGSARLASGLPQQLDSATPAGRPSYIQRTSVEEAGSSVATRSTRSEIDPVC